MESHPNNNNNSNNNVNASSNIQTQQQQQTNVISTGQSFTPAAVAAAATNNNQTVAIPQQQQQPNNNNVIATLPPSFTPSSVHVGGGGGGGSGGGQPSAQPAMYNQPLHSSNIYMPAPGVHQSAGPMYPAMIQTQIPSNVFVNNVTANVNLHGWTHSVPAYIQSGGPHHYIHGEVPTDQNGQVMQPLQAMPISLAPSNAITGPNGNGNPSNPSGMGGSGGGSGRGSRRGRGRGGSGGSRRSDYNNQRHMLQQEGSPAPQQNQQDQLQQQQMSQQQQQQQSQQIETHLMPAGPHTYVPHPQYSHAAPPYPYAAYQTYFTPQSHMLHPSQSAAQQATGPPLYVSPMPLYNSPQVYMGGYIYPPHIMNAAEYQYVASDDGQGDDRHSAETMIPQIWHTQPIYPDDYAVMNAEMHGTSAEDINHNPSSLGSSETPSMLSPNYPIYDPQMHDMQQQMGVLQLYEDPQTGQIQQIHTGGVVQQLEDDMSECDAQTGGTIQMVSSSGAIITAAPMQMASDTQIIHRGHPQQPPHHLMQATIMGMEPHQQAHLQAQQQHQQYNSVTLAAEQHIILDNNNQSNEIMHLQSGESMSSLNEGGDDSHQSSENINQDYQQQLQLQQQQPHQQNAVEISAIAAANENYNVCNSIINNNNNNNNNINDKLVMTDANEFTETVPNNSNNVAVVVNIPAAVPATQQQQIQTSPQELQQEQQQRHHQQHQQQQHTMYRQQQQQEPVQQLQQPPPQAQIQQQAQIRAQSPSTQQHQQQPHHHHHQTQYHPQQHQHEQRKQPQNFSQQTRRKYTSDYNSNNNNMQQQQQQQQHQPHVPSNNNNNIDSSIQTTKSMSWTNSSQHKKSTASVAVTATPVSNISGGSNKQSNSSYSQPRKTYTNQQHHYQQQQPNQHYHSHQQQQQQNYNQPQMRNYGAMKVPSSPVGTAPPQLISGGGDRKNSQVELQQQQQQPKNNYNSSNSTTATTSTASTTATPQQFPQQLQQQNTTAEPFSSSSTLSASAYTTTHHNNKQYPGFAHKKSMTSTNTATVATALSPPAINLAPPVTNVNAANSTPAGTPSWASLFANKSSNNATVAIPTQITAAGANAVVVAGVVSQLAGTTQQSAANVAQPQQLSQQAVINNIGSTTHSNPPFATKKPIAKVAPYEGITPVTPTPVIIPPGGMSYSAASAQGLPPPATAAATAAAAAAINNKPIKQKSEISAAIQRNSTNLDEWTLRFADFLTKYKTDLPPISLRPRGLTNRSNYCYINSILQALLGCSPFYNLIRAIPKQAAALSEVKTPTVNAMISFMSNFSTLPSCLRLRTNKGPKGKDDLGGDLQCDPAFEPTEIYKLWNDSREEHVEGRQEDAEEFLGYVLNKLNDEMLEVIKLIAKPNPEQNGQNELSESEDGDAWQMICNNRNKGSVTRQTDFGRTPLSDIFRGELRSRLQREGEHSTDVIQPFFTLQLNIEKAASVKEALEILVGRDQLEGVTGSKSKQEVVAWQQMTLEKLPVILILHLKWFDYRSDGCTKILKKVEFPVDLKIDTKILASKKYSQKQRAYRLFAVVYHDGKEASKGHYITDVYHTGYGSWLRYDDSSVKPVSENHVLLPRTPRVPYLLYYRRCDSMTHAPTSNAGNNSTTSSSSGRERDSGK